MHEMLLQLLLKIHEGKSSVYTPHVLRVFERLPKSFQNSVDENEPLNSSGNAYQLFMSFEVVRHRRLTEQIQFKK